VGERRRTSWRVVTREGRRRREKKRERSLSVKKGRAGHFDQSKYVCSHVWQSPGASLVSPARVPDRDRSHPVIHLAPAQRVPTVTVIRIVGSRDENRTALYTRILRDAQSAQDEGQWTVQAIERIRAHGHINMLRSCPCLAGLNVH
jgi:hypothetical protein